MATKSNKTNAVVETGLANLTNADSAKDVIFILQEQLKGIKKETDCPWKAGDGLLPVGGAKLNIRTTENIDQLIAAGMSVRSYFRQWDQTVGVDLKDSLVGVKIERKLAGGAEEDWMDDIKKKIKQVSSTERVAKLESIIEKSRKFLSEKEQFQVFLMEAAAAVGATPIQEA